MIRTCLTVDQLEELYSELMDNGKEVDIIDEVAHPPEYSRSDDSIIISQHSDVVVPLDDVINILNKYFNTTYSELCELTNERVS